MFKRCTIKHNHKGLVFRDGKYAQTLSAGRHTLFGRLELQVQSVTTFPAQIAELDRLYLESKDALASELQFVQTSRDEVALVQKGAQFLLVKPLQTCAFWRDVEPLAIESMAVPSDLLLPKAWLEKLDRGVTLSCVKQVTVAAGQFGLLLCDGKLVAALGSGRHAYFDVYPKIELQICPGNRAISKQDLIEEFKVHCAGGVDSSVRSALRLVSVAADELVVLKDTAGPVDVCAAGNEFLVAADLEMVRISLSQVPLPLPDWLLQALRNTGDAPASRAAHFANLLRKSCVSWEVAADHCGVLYVDGVMHSLLTPGFHAYFSGGKVLSCKSIDQRLTMLEIVGQEILSQDKVPLRVNVTVGYQVKDAAKAVSSLNKYEEFIYKEVQFALRAAVGSKTLDALLENKNVLDAQIHGYASPALEEHGIHLQSAGIKDLILPGEIKAILSKVVEAEKTAQANVIRRREETASTRSLLNTAKVMEDSPIALRMKELETLERVSEKIDKISVFGGLDGVLKGMVNLTK